MVVVVALPEEEDMVHVQIVEDDHVVSIMDRLDTNQIDTGTSLANYIVG